MKNEDIERLVLKIGSAVIDNSIVVIDPANPVGKNLELTGVRNSERPEKLASDILTESMNELFKPVFLAEITESPPKPPQVTIPPFELNATEPAVGVWNSSSLRSIRNTKMSMTNGPQGPIGATGPTGPTGSNGKSRSPTIEVLRRPIPGRNELELLVSSTDGCIKMAVVQKQRCIYVVGEYKPKDDEFTSSTHLVDGDSLAVMVMNHDWVRYSEGPPIEEVKDDKFWRTYMADALKLSSVASVLDR